MKLSEVISYATNHARFKQFLQERNIPPDSAHSIMAKISTVTERAIEHRIYIDFGHPGQSSNDVRVIVDFNKGTQDFEFIQIDHPVRTTLT